MKSIIAAGLLLGCAHGAAIAGPYANVESNTAWYGNDYEGVVTEAHVGFEDVIGEKGSYYIQAGPAFVAVDGEDTELNSLVKWVLPTKSQRTSRSMVSTPSSRETSWVPVLRLA